MGWPSAVLMEINMDRIDTSFRERIEFGNVIGRADGALEKMTFSFLA